MTSESQIDDLFEAWLKVKADKKFEKQMEKGLLYGIDKRFSYHIVGWNVPIKAMLMTANGREVIKNKIVQIIKISDKFKIRTILQPNESQTSEIQTSSDFGIPM